VHTVYNEIPEPQKPDQEQIYVSSTFLSGHRDEARRKPTQRSSLDISYLIGEQRYHYFDFVFGWAARIMSAVENTLRFWGAVDRRVNLCRVGKEI